jgi:hypothetical protein
MLYLMRILVYLTILRVVCRVFLFGGGCGGGQQIQFRAENRERGSGGSRPLARGSGGSCNLVQGISFHIVKVS